MTAKKTTEEKTSAGRQQVAESIEKLANKLVAQIEAKENPSIEIPIRGSSNVFYDEKGKKIVLGDKVAHRYLFNVSHARRFMQTMLVASYVKKDLLANNLTATLRDLYYAKKHTIANTKENTIEEQKESDMAIVDLEVALDTFRERLHLRAEPKGRMAGDMVVVDRVKDKVDTIDLSKMGSGGWAVPSIVEQIEFKDVGVEYVLVAEKNAIFDRLNEDGYWKKNKCLLMTTAGQAARGARRLLQRLSEELKLPIYCLSIDGQESIVVSEDGMITHPQINEYVNKTMETYGAVNCITHEKSIALPENSALEVTSDAKTLEGNVINVVRHPIEEDLFEVTANSGYSVKVTASHSLMAFNSKQFKIIPKTVEELTPDDYLVCPTRVPSKETVTKINLLETIKKRFPGLLKNIEAGNKKGSLQLDSAKMDEIKWIRWKKSKFAYANELPITKELCRLLGYYVSEGSISYKDGVQLTFGQDEKELVSDAIDCIKKTFGLTKPKIVTASGATRVVFGGRLACELFEHVFDARKFAGNKRVPYIVYNIPRDLKYEFLKGCFRGDGCLTIRKKGSCVLEITTKSRKLASDLVFLLHQLGSWANVYKQKKSKSFGREYYTIKISDYDSLKLLEEVVIDLAKIRGKKFGKNFIRKALPNSKYLGIPVRLLNELQPELLKVSKKGFGRIAGSGKSISFTKFSRIIQSIYDRLEKGLIRNKVYDALPESGKELTAQEISRKTHQNLRSVYTGLRKLLKQNLVAVSKINGKAYWRKIVGAIVEEKEVRRKLEVLKNIAEHRIVLLQVKSITRTKPSEKMVYDVEVNPTHTFVGGLGGIQLKNTDADPYGWYIYSVAKFGSMALAHESDRLGCPAMHFLGMSVSDIEHYDLRGVTIKAKDVDIKRAQEMKAYDWFKAKEWQSEINKFLEKKVKAEIQALSSKNLQYISNTYLPEKIKSQDFLP